MKRMTALARLLLAVFGLGVACSALPATISLVEYHHAAWDHYFVTGIPDEIAKLDAGVFVGWARTGQQFNAYSLGTAGTSPTCRFFSTSFAPRSSHFYTPFASECATVKANPNWQFEAEVFNVALPDTAGNCPTGTSPLYRLYNNGQGGAPNHRYTTSLSIRSTMLGQGWIPEGYGTIGVIACVPSYSVNTKSAEGLWFGKTNQNQTVWGVVLSDGTYYVIYSQSGNTTIAGVIQGSGNFANGTFSSSNGRDFNITPYGSMFNATVTGSYVPQSTITGNVTEAGNTGSFSAAYDSTYEQPVSLDAAAGTYSASVASSTGWQSAVVTLTTSGALAGSGAGCSFSGTALPHGAVNVLDVTVQFHGGQCIFDTSTLSGIAYYDVANRVMYGAAPNASRTDGFLFVGTK